MAQQPMYQKIAEEIRKQIDEGILERGTQLPTEIELGINYSASRNTVRDAIKQLTSQGLVETKPGRGTFVTTKIDPFVTVLSGDPQALGGAEGATYLSDVEEKHRQASVSGPKVEIQVPPAEVARRLHVEPPDQVISRHQTRYIDRIPWSMQTSFYPMEFVTKGAHSLLTAQNIEEGTVRYIAKTIGIRQIGYQDWITVRGPDTNEQAFFRVENDATVFENFRTAFDQDGNPLRVTVTIFPTDRNHFIINVGEVPGTNAGDIPN